MIALSFKPKKEDDDAPLLKPGKLAVCKYCGYCGVDFNKCQRCRRKLPDDVKSQDNPAGSKFVHVTKLKVSTPPKTPVPSSKLVTAIPSSSSPKAKPTPDQVIL